MTIDAKMAAARSFVRSLNILLKFVRLYGFDHARSAEQFDNAWSELRASIPPGGETGLLLGAAGSQLLLDGVPIDGAHAERSFAQLLSAAGLASIQFLPGITKEELERFVRAFPVGNSKPSALAEQLRTALGSAKGIRINEVRFVAEDSSTTDARPLASLMAKTLGKDSEQFKAWMNDPQKLLQLIAAAEGSRGNAGPSGGNLGTGVSGGGSGPGGGGSTTSTGTGWGMGGPGGAAAGAGTGAAGTGGPGSGASGTGWGGRGIGGAGSGSGRGPVGSGPGGPEQGGSGFMGGSAPDGSGSAGNGTGALGPAGIGPGSGGNNGEAGGGSGPGTGGGSAYYSGEGGASLVEAHRMMEQDGSLILGSGGPGGGPGAGFGESASQSSRGAGTPGSSSTVGSGLGPGFGPGSGNGPGTGFGPGPGGGPGTGFGARDDEILNILRLLSQLGQTASAGAGMEPGPFQQEISKFSGRSRELLQQALASVAKQTPALKSNDPMLLRLAEHLAIRFALDRYERGEVRVNAVREMLDRMSQEIGTLRQVLGTHEEKMAEAGILVESHADVLDRQFWASVPAAAKSAVLTSSDAWCIPPRNVRQFIEELRQAGEFLTASAILENYGSAVGYENPTARKRTAIGLSELADLYAAGDGRPLTPTIRRTGVALGLEREAEVQGLLSGAFVRLTQEAGGQKHYRALIQALDSLDTIESQRPAFAQTIRPRLGMEKRLPEFVDEATRRIPRPDGLIEVIDRLPRASTEYLTTRFNRGGSRPDCEGIAHLARALSAESLGCLREILQAAPPAEAAETVGLLTRMDPTLVEKWLGNRLREWPRMPQDRALRLIAGSGAPERGWVLLSLFDQFDAMLQPLAVDEIGMAGEMSAAARLMRMASGDLPSGTGPFLRLKSIEALGRLREARAISLLHDLLEAKKMWRWLYPTEIRIAAFHALCSVASGDAEAIRPHSGIAADDLVLNPLDSLSASHRIRQRRYPRVRLAVPVSAIASNERESIALELRGLSLSGGLASGERHIAPGTLVSLRLGSGLRPIRAQAFMRDARAQGLGFEIAEMDLDERSRLRRLLRDQGSANIAADQALDEHDSVAPLAAAH
jgi:hypothetical protein